MEYSTTLYRNGVRMSARTPMITYIASTLDLEDELVEPLDGSCKLPFVVLLYALTSTA